MIALNAPLATPTILRYHGEAIEKILQCVEEGIYCALLGPRLSGKTVLLRSVEHDLVNNLGIACTYVDLLELRSSTQHTFFEDLIRLISHRLTALTRQEFPPPQEGYASSAVFRGFLLDSLETVGSDLVLIFDPLEALPTDLVQALLTSLRAAYMDQQTLENQVTVVVSGALSLASLTVGESSPFRGIARRVFVEDPSEAESQELILEFLGEQGTSATRTAFQRLLHATRGDIYLIRHITSQCIELARTRSYPLLRARDVNYITAKFLKYDVFQYAPLLDAIRLIEDDPDLLRCILLLLERNIVPRSELPLPLSPDLDPLYLTGVVEEVAGNCYRLQNLIYRQFLAQHFLPGRVGRVLTMAGRWDSAIDYLETGAIQGDVQSQLDLLPATINSMYASQDLAQAVYFLKRGLSAAFSVKEAQIWYAEPQENVLRLVGSAGSGVPEESFPSHQISKKEDRLESRSFRQQAPLRGQESEQRVARAIPLLIPGREPIGVVTIYDELVNDLFTRQRDRDLQLIGFLNQAARALQAVSMRRQELALAGRLQASLLPDKPPETPGWQIAATWRPARETAGDFYDFISLPDGKLGIVIADVVDKGMGAALLMALTRTLIRTYAAGFLDLPHHLLHVANQRLISDVTAGLFVTLFYGILNPSTGRLSYSNAGHPPPYLVSPGKTATPRALYRTGMPLGISDEAAWGFETLQISRNGLLFLYTDGILEAQNLRGELFGERGILNIVQKKLGSSAQEIQDAVLSGIYSFTGAQPQSDDITLMTLLRSQ